VLAGKLPRRPCKRLRPRAPVARAGKAKSQPSRRGQVHRTEKAHGHGVCTAPDSAVLYSPAGAAHTHTDARETGLCRRMSNGLRCSG
jgi:hypothetical protein